MPAGDNFSADETLRRHLPQLAIWPGWHALIQGDRLVGLFPTRAAAERAWAELIGPVPAAIRQVPATAKSSARPPAELNHAVRRTVPRPTIRPYQLVPRRLDASDLPSLLAQSRRLIAQNLKARATGRHTFERTVALLAECRHAQTAGHDAAADAARHVAA